MLQCINSLHSNGIEIHTQEGLKVVHVKVLTCICDTISLMLKL